jgi:transcriptional regulator with XRE-family HTH domain
MSTKTNPKNTGGSSSFTRSARRSGSKTFKTPKLPEGLSMEFSEPEVVKSKRSNFLDDLIRTPKFQLGLDNNVPFRVASNAIRMRKYRRKSQSEVASAMGTSQPRIARLESGDDNITLATLRKLIDALDGRLVFAIQPAEIHMPSLPQWWEAPLFASQRGWQPAGARLHDIDPDYTTLITRWTTAGETVGTSVPLDSPEELT